MLTDPREDQQAPPTASSAGSTPAHETPRRLAVGLGGTEVGAASRNNWLEPDGCGSPAAPRNDGMRSHCHVSPGHGLVQPGPPDSRRTRRFAGSLDHSVVVG